MATTKKRTTKKTASASGAKKSGKGAVTKKERQARNQLWAIVLFALGVLLFCVALVEGGALWKWFHTALRGCLSWCAFLVGPIVIYTAVMVALDQTDYPIAAKVISSCVLILLFSGASQIFLKVIPEGGLFQVIRELYADGTHLIGGGALSVLVGVPLLKLMDFTGAAITVVLLIFVFLMILSGGTLMGLFRTAAKPVKKIEEVYTSAVESRAVAQNGSSIDIPIDDEDHMPAHPVRSPKGSMEGRQPLMKSRKKLLDATADMTAPDRPPFDIDIGEDPAPAPAAASAAPKAAAPHPDIDDIITRAVSGETTLNGPALETRSGTLEFGGQAPAPAKAAATAVADPEPEAEAAEYILPPVDLLDRGRTLPKGDTTKELKANADRLVDTLKSFGVQTRIVDISRGPAVTRYELQPSAGVKISRITNLADDIALNLAAAGVRIEAPIPNKAAIGIEVPNKIISTVSIREVLDSPLFENAASRLTVALGKDISGSIAVADIAKMPHILIAGATGSGKSVCINSLIISLLFKSSPEEVKLIMIDPKVVELGGYNGIPHLLVPVVTEPKKAAGTLGWAVGEMLKRYKTFADAGVRDLPAYNKLAAAREDLEPMPQIVIIIDELADLMMAAPKDVEDHICRLAQMARAAGMHLIIATQRPSVDVITGVIKANIPSRISFAVSSQVDSRTILDMGGAEKLLGRGDMLFYPVGAAKPTRIQGCFVTDAEVERVVDFIKEGGARPDYDEAIIEEIDKQASAVGAKGNRAAAMAEGGDEDTDSLLEDAIQVVVELGSASTSLLQRRMKVGYARAARLLDEMEQRGIVGPFEGSKPRKVLLSKDQYYERRLMNEQN